MLKKPIINTLVQILGKVITIMISLVVTGILTRKLGVSVYGSFTLVTSIFILLDSLADFGTKIIGVREVSINEEKNLFVQIAWIRLLTTLLAFIIGVILIFTWSGFQNIKIEALVALSMIFFTSLAGSLEIIFQSKLRMDLKILVDIVFPLLFLIVLLAWNQPITLLWVFSTYLIARILSLFVGLGLAKKWVKIEKFSFVNWNFAKKFIKESWPMGLYLIIFAGYDRAVDSLMIERFVGIKEVAFYGLAYKMYSNLVQPAYFFVNSIFPIMSKMNHDRKKFFKLSILLVILGLIIIVPLIYYFSPLMVYVLAGSEFASSVLILRILIIALIFSYIGHLVGFTLIANGGQKEILKLGIVSLVFNIGANLFAIPRYGIVGAAVVTGMTEAITCSLMTLKLWQRTK